MDANTRKVVARLLSDAAYWNTDLHDADRFIEALADAGLAIESLADMPRVRVLSGQLGKGLNPGDPEGRYEQWVQRIDCELNGCEPHHSDNGTGVSIEEDRWFDADGHGSINGHKARAWRRSVIVGPWEELHRGSD